MTHKFCTKCQTQRLVTEYQKNRRQKDGLQHVCKYCVARYARGVKQIGVSHDAYDEMRIEQNGVCRICGYDDGQKRLAVDHCHKTMRVRGLLCGDCNKGLGLFHDRVEWLQQAISYLQEDRPNALTYGRTL